MAFEHKIMPAGMFGTSLTRLLFLPTRREVLLALVLYLLIVGTAMAAPQEPFPPPQRGTENEVCLRCHSSPGLKADLPSGEELNLYIDPITFEESVHGRQGQRCTACHTNITGYPHPPLYARDRRAYNLEMYPLCRGCHGDKYAQTLDSMHAKALAGGDRNAAMCTDCHGAHDTSDPHFPRAKISNTCAKCHSAIFNEYKDSIHGAALLEESNPDVPTCIDCHGVHHMVDPRTAAFRVSSPEICGKCHANTTLMARYGISIDVFNTYVADFHGTTVELFEKLEPNQPTNKAVCYDCHGIHNIKKVTDKEATVIKENLLTTCRKCHPDATANFPASWTSHYQPSPQHYPIVYYVNLFYQLFIPSVVGFMLGFIFLDAGRRLVDRRRNKSALGALIPMMEPPRKYQRFSSGQRLDHWFMMLSFTVLSITGVPQKFAGTEWAEVAIRLMGGIELVRVIHRISAMAMMVGAILHLFGMGYRVLVLRQRLSMLPLPRDLVDMLDAIRYNLGLAIRRPLLDRFSFEEKVEYWAVIWGTLLMVATGFMLWNPIATARFVPGEYIPAAKAAHGGEAILAILSILTWHIYNVHLKHFNRSIFTGFMTRKEMEHEHPLELARIESGRETVVDRETKRRRERVFLPVATVLTLVSLVGIYFFITFEETAIATVPMAKIVAYAPITPTPMRVVRRPLPTRPSAIMSTPRPGTTPQVARTATPVPSFNAEVLPVFESKCTTCHSTGQSLMLTSYQRTMEGGPSGPIVVPGKPSESLLVQKMYELHPAKTTDQELDRIKAWIAGGAPNN